MPTRRVPVTSDRHCGLLPRSKHLQEGRHEMSVESHGTRDLSPRATVTVAVTGPGAALAGPPRDCRSALPVPGQTPDSSTR